MDLGTKACKDIVNSFTQVSNESFGQLATCFEHRSMEKGTVFVRRGYPDENEYFLREGICRSFLLSPEGDETTLSFFQAPAVLTPHVTRTVKGIALLNFEALTPLVLTLIKEEELLALMVKNLDIREFGNTVLRNELIEKVNKEIGLATLTARERLLAFRKQYKGLENLLPHPIIASYLGITNISLSRLRRELAKG